MSAQSAVMRKVILLAHSLYKNNQTYDETKYIDYINIDKKAAQKYFMRDSSLGKSMKEIENNTGF